MERPKDRVDRGRFIRIFFEHQHALLNVLQQILRRGTKQRYHFLIRVGSKTVGQLLFHIFQGRYRAAHGRLRCRLSACRLFARQRRDSGCNILPPIRQRGAGQEIFPRSDSRLHPRLPFVESLDCLRGQTRVGGDSFVDPSPSRTLGQPNKFERICTTTATYTSQQFGKLRKQIVNPIDAIFLNGIHKSQFQRDVLQQCFHLPSEGLYIVRHVRRL